MKHFDLLTDIRNENQATIAAIKGEIDLHKSPELRLALLQVIEEHKPQKLVLDLAAVPYMDSSGIAVLVEALKKMRPTGGKVYLSNLQPRIKGLIEIARLDTVFVLVKDSSEAISK